MDSKLIYAHIPPIIATRLWKNKEPSALESHQICFSIFRIKGDPILLGFWGFVVTVLFLKPLEPF